MNTELTIDSIAVPTEVSTKAKVGFGIAVARSRYRSAWQLLYRYRKWADVLNCKPKSCPNQQNSPFSLLWLISAPLMQFV